MTFFQSAVYGIVQGLTEFLPVSSSAHLALFPWFFGWKNPGLAFDVALHWGTLLGVLLYFRKDVMELFFGWMDSFKGKREPLNILPWQIILATIPGAIFGLLFEKKAETVFRSPLLIAGTLAGAGILLWIADKITEQKTNLTNMTWKKSLLIGLSQGLAVIPGVSRSGITIATGLFTSLDRSSAVRFSFLLSIPIILGAGVKKIGYFAHNLGNVHFWIGLVCSAISGFIAIHFLLKFIKGSTFKGFVYYRFALAILILVWFFAGHH